MNNFLVFKNLAKTSLFRYTQFSKTKFLKTDKNWRDPNKAFGVQVCVWTKTNFMRQLSIGLGIL